MIARAFAKINLGLEVLFRRQDGYHELRTILQTIDLHDRLRFDPARAGIELATHEPDLPVGRQNLVVKAAESLARACGASTGVRIELEKHVPPGRGLGGGSADAAMTLLALNELWGAGFDIGELDRLARELGADVPFFLYGGTALGVGRGDEVYPLEREMNLPIVLILPEIAIETAAAYRSLILTNRESSLRLQYFAASGPDGGEDFPYLVNDLESAARELFPSIDEYKQSLLELGAAASLMSGSGSAVFGIFRDEAVARRAEESLVARGIRAVATRTLSRKSYLKRRLQIAGTNSGRS